MVKNQSLVTKNNEDNENKISTIEEAGIGKRLFSAIMDAVVFLFLGMILYLFVFTPIAKAGFNYEGNQVLATQYEVASHLYVYQQADDDYVYHVVEVKDYTEKMDASKSARVQPLYQIDNTDYKWYLSHLHYYYTSYLTGKNIELPTNTSSKIYDPIADHFVSPNYDKYVQNTNMYPYEFYTDDWFASSILKIDNPDSYFIRDKSKISFIDQISLKEGAGDSIKLLKEYCYNATGEFYNSDYFSGINNSIKWSQIFIVAMSATISFSVFYIIIPLIFKDGSTLGKKVNKLALISSSGYSVKKRQVIFRQVVLFVELGLSSCIVGIGLTSIATLGVGVVILLICTLISKTHRAPHDYAAYTLLVDVPKSVWFDSPEAETKAATELNEKMAQYKNKKIIEKSVIQIGDEIINDDFKQEINEENVEKEK